MNNQRVHLRSRCSECYSARVYLRSSSNESASNAAKHERMQVVTQALAFNESQRAVSNKAQSQAHKAKYKSVLEASKAKMTNVRSRGHHTHHRDCYAPLVCLSLAN